MRLFTRQRVIIRTCIKRNIIIDARESKSSHFALEIRRDVIVFVFGFARRDRNCDTKVELKPGSNPIIRLRISPGVLLG